MLLGQAAETQCPETVRGIIHRQSTCLQLELEPCQLYFHVLSRISLLTYVSFHSNDYIFKEGKQPTLL